MKKRITAIAILFLLVNLLFCLDVKAETEGNSNTVTKDGIEVTISTDKSEYKAGEIIKYTISVVNTKENWQVNAGKFQYDVTKGMIAAQEGSMPDELPVVASGETVTLEGMLVGDDAIFTRTADTQNSYWIYLAAGIAAAVVIIVVVILVIKKKKNIGKKATMLLFASILFTSSVPADAAEWVEATIRPYVKVTYAGEEITIRTVMNLKLLQIPLSVSSEDQMTYKRITCHDPSIFRDFDGRYYIIGSFLAMGYTDDLYNWTSEDSDFQGSFTEEVREQIRAYNNDGTAGNWNDYLWAPDVIYNPVLEKYCIYLSANGDNWKSNIVLLTSDTIDGNYEYAGSIVYGGFDEDTYAQTDAPQVIGEETIPERYLTNGVGNRKWGDMWPNCIDPCVFYDAAGNLWMAYGSWSGGIFMLALDEETGLRDYTVSYEENLHSDPYFGTKIAGGAYVSGEASYIQQVGDYYYLFISYGNLEAAGGYNIRVYRSDRPDGGYVDELGNTPYYDTYSFNYNQAVGIRLFGGYKWRSFTYGQVAQGHNSAFVDEDGKAYIVFHTRTSNGSEGHYVKVHQLFVNKEGWLVAAPYQTTGETMSKTGYSVSEVAGEYEVILHDLDIDYGNLETKRPEIIRLEEDGTVTGAYSGSWLLETGTPYITLTLNGEKYSGVTLKMNIEGTKIETMVWTALGTENQLTIWGSKSVE